MPCTVDARWRRLNCRECRQGDNRGYTSGYANGLGENWLARGGGGVRAPFLDPFPPFWAPVTGTPDGLTVTLNRLTGEGGGS